MKIKLKDAMRLADNERQKAIVETHEKRDMQEEMRRLREELWRVQNELTKLRYLVEADKLTDPLEGGKGTEQVAPKPF